MIFLHPRDFYFKLYDRKTRFLDCVQYLQTRPLNRSSKTEMLLSLTQRSSRPMPAQRTNRSGHGFVKTTGKKMQRNLSNINIATDVYVASGHLSDVEI